MPAAAPVRRLKHFRTDPLPDALVIDTSIFIAGLIKLPRDQIRHDCTYRFFRRILSEKIVVLVSDIVYPEFWSACLKIELDGRLGNRQDVWQALVANPSLYTACCPSIKSHIEQLYDLRATFGSYWRPVKLSHEVMMDAIDIQSTHHLKQRDAIHVASCKGKEIAAFDNGIVNANVPDLKIWCRYDVGGHPEARSIPTRGQQSPQPSPTSS